MGIIWIGLLSGCEQRATAKYYYNPFWTADGKIVASRETATRVTGSLTGSGSDRATHWVIMDADGSNERELIGLDPEGFPRGNASPSGNYIASNGGAGLEIWSYPGFHKLNEIAIPEWVRYVYTFDWSPDESRLVIAYGNDSTSEIAIYTRQGIKERVLTDITGAGAWKYNIAIFGYFGSSITEGARLVLADGSVVNEGLASAQQFFPGGETYLGLGGGGDIKPPILV